MIYNIYKLTNYKYDIYKFYYNSFYIYRLLRRALGLYI